MLLYIGIATMEHLLIVVGVVLSVALLIFIFVLRHVLSERPQHACTSEFYAERRRFLITGAAGGIGSSLGRRLLAEGHCVCLSDISHGAIAAQCAAAEGPDSWIAVEHDVSDVVAWERVLDVVTQKWGGVDVIVNCAGYLLPSYTTDCSAAQIDTHIDVNLKGVIYGTVQGAKAMLQWSADGTLTESGGHILNISSLGALMPVSGVALYQAAKFGVRGFSVCASKDFLAKALPLAATCICPDAVATPMKELQLRFDESAMAYSGGDLSAEYVVDQIVRVVLPQRPVEVLLGAGACRAMGAVLCAPFHSSRLVHWIEGAMRVAGVRKQQAIRSAGAKTGVKLS